MDDELAMRRSTSTPTATEPCTNPLRSRLFLCLDTSSASASVGCNWSQSTCSTGCGTVRGAAVPCQAKELEVGGTEVMRMEVCGAPGASRGRQQQQQQRRQQQQQRGGGGAFAERGSRRGGLIGRAACAPSCTSCRDNEGRTSLMRLVGDTFEFHSLYRKLRERLADITVPQSGGANAWSGR